ncbi:MAG: FAD-binding oxidoreductase [Armatimonadetes bacterium]|nr:FAD-binding oxidoreductase [Armatimonadota bacterium]
MSASRSPDMSILWPCVADRPPAEVLAPASRAEAAAEVARALRHGLAIVPVGAGTRLAEANLMRGVEWIAVDMAGMDRVLAYSPDDMTVVVEPGVTAEALQAVLADAGQFAALGLESGPMETVGGLVAANAQGRWQCAYGLPRDQLLGFRAVLSNGAEVRFGGCTVKNVAGYDVGKLFCGSHGTLGLITELTLRARPLPPVRSTLVLAAPSLSDALAAGVALHLARLLPTGLVVTLDAEPALTVEFSGSGETVVWQLEQARRVAAGCGLQTAATTTAHPIPPVIPESGVAWLRAATVSTALEGLCRAVEPCLRRAAVHVAAGIVEAEVTLSEPLDETEGRLFAAGCRHLRRLRLPQSERPTRDAWRLPAAQLPLMRAVKGALDPAGAFGPGRFAGRI